MRHLQRHDYRGQFCSPSFRNAPSRVLVVPAAFDGLVFVELPLPKEHHLPNSSESNSGIYTLRFAFAAISKFETSERFRAYTVYI